MSIEVDVFLKFLIRVKNIRILSTRFLSNFPNVVSPLPGRYINLCAARHSALDLLGSAAGFSLINVFRAASGRSNAAAIPFAVAWTNAFASFGFL